MRATQDNMSCPIQIHFCHGQYLVWSANDVDFLRREYGIVGCLTGCFSQIPKQNSQLGLPLQLNRIQAKFVLENCNAKLTNCSLLITSQNCDEISSKELEFRKTQQKLQRLIKKEQKADQIEEMADEIKMGKLKKYKKLTQSNATSTSVTSTDNDDRIEIESKVKEICSEEYFKKFTDSELKKVDFTDQIWIAMPVRGNCVETETFIDHCIELSADETLEFCVMSDLIHKGYIVTDGRKFGGHFLVYPGDPGLYHSTYIAYCLPFEKELSAIEFATLGRLATSVKKTLLLCSVDTENSVIYNSVSWSGLV